MEVRVVPSEPDLTDATLVIGVLRELQPTPGSETAFARVDSLALEAAGFEGKKGESVVVPYPEARAALLVGLGEEADFDTVRAASGVAVRTVKTSRLVSLLPTIGIEQATRAVTEGSLLGGFQFRDYKTNGDGLSVTVVELVGGDETEMQEASVVAEATNRTRAWVNTPAMDLSPSDFASQIEELASSTSIEVDVWDRPRIEDEGLGALLGVAAGSDRDPRLVVLSYRPDGATSHLGLVGKGITFDSGGLSIKPASGMEDMKDDMAGAATVVAATVAIAQLQLPINVTCVTPITDNAISGDATRPGDVLRPVEGPTIEVLNTDAEGRLVLADGLGIVRRHQPDMIVDVATLTGAARVALGDRIAAVFASDDETAEKVLAAASRAGEHFWQMPLFKDYRKSLDSNIADIKNVSGSRYGGAIVAAVFLAEYAGDGPWAHLDIAGPAMSRETNGDHVKGASGIGVRTLVELARAGAAMGSG